MRTTLHARSRLVIRTLVVSAVALGVGISATACSSSASDAPAPGSAPASSRTTSTIEHPARGGDLLVHPLSKAAHFWTAQPGTCRVEKDGPCERILECDHTPFKAESAGDIVMECGYRRVALVPDEKGTYTEEQGQDGHFEPGAAVKIGARGAAIPGFEVTSKMPQEITLTSPVFTSKGGAPAPDQYQTAFSRSQPLQLSWTGGGEGDVRVSLSGFRCSFPAAAGAGTIPATVIADAEPSGTMIVESVIKTHMDVGAYAIELEMQGLTSRAVFTTTN